MIDRNDFKKLIVGSIEWEDKLELIFKELEALRAVANAARKYISDEFASANYSEWSDFKKEFKKLLDESRRG
jgi:cell fate (sporulation/competence/biofilm development) regulator YlbF (YheA/YmcA/DUF963 family)